MKTITIITPANIEIEYRLAGAGSRLAAFIIDFILQLLGIGLLAAIVLLGIDPAFSPGSPPSGTSLGIVIVGGFIIHFGYFIFCELTMAGQTIGKRLFGLRAIRDNGQPIDFTQSLVRGVFRTAADMFYVGIFIILLSSKCKRLGDMVAGTLVICEYHNPGGADQAFFDTSQQTLPDFLAPYEENMTPEERQLVDLWLKRRHILPERGIGLGQKINDYFAQSRKEIS